MPLCPHGTGGAENNPENPDSDKIGGQDVPNDNFGIMLRNRPKKSAAHGSMGGGSETQVAQGAITSFL
jgi:hypothetical protein